MSEWGTEISKILVTGAGGYVGSRLVPALLNAGHEVVAVDTFWFGDHLSEDPKLTKVVADIRYLDASSLPALDSIIHLAAIANDPSVDLDPTLSWEVGCLGTRNICEIGKQKRIGSLILASSGSVYGIKDEPEVTEDLDLVPISVYNKVKMVKERIALSYTPDFRVVVFRPATICGWSPRLRLDLAVNALTYGALKNKKITVFGGGQSRPQLHIEDMVDAYLWALGNGQVEGIFNLGFENDSILGIAEKVQSLIPSEIEISESNDPRSYRLTSRKVLDAGFVPKRGSIDAIRELAKIFNEGNIEANDSNYNVNWMRKFLAEQSIEQASK